MEGRRVLGDGREAVPARRRRRRMGGERVGAVLLTHVSAARNGEAGGRHAIQRASEVDGGNLVQRLSDRRQEVGDAVTHQVVFTSSPARIPGRREAGEPRATGHLIGAVPIFPCERLSQLFVRLLEARILLLQFANADGWRWEDR